MARFAALRFSLNFLLMLALLVSAFIAALAVLNAERQLTVTETALDRTEYALEVMVRTIRQADPGTVAVIRPPGCGSESCLRFTHPTKGVIEYQYCTRRTTACTETNVILETVNGVPTPLTPPNLLVRNLAFALADGKELNDQPRVTMLVSLGAKPAAYAALDAQTTVTLRRLAK